MHKVNQTQTQTLGYLLETLQSQRYYLDMEFSCSCEPTLQLEQSQKQQPVPNLFPCQPAIPTKPVVPPRSVRSVKRKSHIILLTPVRFHYLSLL